MKVSNSQICFFTDYFQDFSLRYSDRCFYYFVHSINNNEARLAPVCMMQYSSTSPENNQTSYDCGISCGICCIRPP